MSVCQQREEIVYENVGPCGGGPAGGAASAINSNNNDKSSSVKKNKSGGGIPHDVIVGVLERMVFELEVSRGEGSMSRLCVAREETETTGDMIDVIRHVFPIVVDVQVETLANCFADEEFGGGSDEFTPPPATIDGLLSFLSLASSVETSPSTPPTVSSTIRSLRARIRGIYLPPYHHTTTPLNNE